MRYEVELDFLDKHEDPNQKSMNTRKKLTDLEIQKLKNDFLNIPEDYLDYLKEVGEGSFRECQFSVHNCLETINDLVGFEMCELEEVNNFLVFGGNFSGDFSGFLKKGYKWILAEYWHDSEEFYFPKKTFHEYIREQMLIGGNGEDLREK